MARVKNGAVTKARHKKVLKAAKGYVGSKHRLYKTAKEQLMTSRKYAYRDRKNRKRDFRKLWITRINAACRMFEISYSRFISGLTKAGVEVNRKVLSEIAINDIKTFEQLVLTAKKGLEGKIKKDEEVAGKEVTLLTDTKKETKEKVEKVKKVDYSSMKVAELKELAVSKNIDVTGLKKAEIIEKLEK